MAESTLSSIQKFRVSNRLLFERAGSVRSSMQSARIVVRRRDTSPEKLDGCDLMEVDTEEPIIVRTLWGGGFGPVRTDVAAVAFPVAGDHRRNQVFMTMGSPA